MINHITKQVCRASQKLLRKNVYKFTYINTEETRKAVEEYKKDPDPKFYN